MELAPGFNGKAGVSLLSASEYRLVAEFMSHEVRHSSAGTFLK
jgi:hypothetical protein